MLAFSAVCLAAAVLGWGGEPKAEVPEAWKKIFEAADKASIEGRRDEAEAMLRGVVAESEKFGPDDLRVAEPLEQLGSMILTQRNRIVLDRDKPNPRYDEGEAMMLRALAIREKNQGPDHPEVAKLLINLGTLKLVLSRKPERQKEANIMLRRAVAITEAKGPEDPDLARALHGLAMLDFMNGKIDHAEPYLLRALAIREKRFGPKSLKVAAILDDLGDVEVFRTWKATSMLSRAVIGPWTETQAERHGKKALDYYTRALAIRETHLKPDHIEISETVFNLGQLQMVRAEYEDAEAYLLRWLAMKNTSRAKRVTVLYDLSHLSWKRHHWAASREWTDEAEALDETLRSKAPADPAVSRAVATDPSGR